MNNKRTIYINVDNLINNIERFNAENDTNFSNSSTLAEVQSFFHEELNSFYYEQNNNLNPIDRFNDLYQTYAFVHE